MRLEPRLLVTPLIALALIAATRAAYGGNMLELTYQVLLGERAIGG